MRCIIICGSPDYDIDFIKSSVKEDDYIICADRGYMYALQAEIKPNLIVGDFDSCTLTPDKAIETVSLPTHKDDTDTLHAIDVALEKGCNEILLLCATGGRFDHYFANVSALQYITQKNAYGVIDSKDETVKFLSIGKHSFANLKGLTFSIFPFGCNSVCLSIDGAEYPLSKGVLESSFPMGISNVFTSNQALIEIYDGNAIIIINNNI